MKSRRADWSGGFFLLCPGSGSRQDGMGAALFEAERYREARRFEDALSVYRVLLEIISDSALIPSNVGATLYHLGRSQEALRSFERALTLDPDLKIDRTGLAQVRKLLTNADNSRRPAPSERIVTDGHQASSFRTRIGPG